MPTRASSAPVEYTDAHSGWPGLKARAPTENEPFAGAGRNGVTATCVGSTVEPRSAAPR